ncbi:hypothetical protein M513_09301 [Trichuris suis]|uniref:Uncharacterized protein n=1 Tax=Trichuris suis TaxID=68888 RepID=A0A085LXY8_9BILA|nr:hypothetical protein M513_09301 [Trichuris suis]
MELQAALVAFRLGTKIKRELTIKPTTATYWTDSTTVLHWLVASGKRYHTFVANRIGEILEGSDPKQWRYVPSKQNPADVCSRGMKTDVRDAYRRWLEGPEFLGKETNEWPVQCNDKSTISAQAEELLPKWAGHINCTKGPVDELIPRISDIRTLRRIIAYANRFIKNCRSRSHKVTLDQLTN